MTAKERMLRAYRGVAQPRAPVAPEFWYYYPAKLLGVSMVSFQREVPFWQALQKTFRAFGCEGWGAAFAAAHHPDATGSGSFVALGGGRYRETGRTRFRGRDFVSTAIYDEREPCWGEKLPVDDAALLPEYFEMCYGRDVFFDFADCVRAHDCVGGDYLLEFWLGVPFFDAVSGPMGFEPAIEHFYDADERALTALYELYLAHMLRLVDAACAHTRYESFVLGCSNSCVSLEGARLWRKWDKPMITAVAERLHAHGRLLHVHFHGKCREVLRDFAQAGIDCVCPFERGPGGDIDGFEGLVSAREALGDAVTMNGNVHTVETLIRGTPEDVRREVGEIRRAFRGSHRYIIGTGDQVGAETPEDNLWAMIEAARAAE